MKLRSVAASIGAVVTLAAAAPSFAGSDIGTYPPAPPPESLYPFNQFNQPPTSPPTLAGQPVVVAPGSGNVTSGSTQAGTRIMTDNQGHRIVVDSAYADTPGRGSGRAMPDSTVDRTIGVVTAPGYMGPRDTRGQ